MLGLATGAGVLVVLAVPCVMVLRAEVVLAQVLAVVLAVR